MMETFFMNQYDPSFREPLNKVLLDSVCADSELRKMFDNDALASHVFNRCLRDKDATRESLLRELALAQYAAKKDVLLAYTNYALQTPARIL